MDTRTIAVVVLGVLVAGCGSMPEERAVSGAGIGAGAGAALGAVTGMSVATGALIGAAAGAVTGAVTDRGQVNLGEPVWKRQGAGGSAGPQGTTSPDPARIDTVTAIQSRLTALGYAPGPVDGRIGPRTEAAIRWYQRQHELLEDGRATPELADHLQSRGRPATIPPG